jgi:hypothetical protein
MDKLDWLFWISLIVLIGGVIAFMYGSVEVINHKSEESDHKAAYWGGFVAEILGLIGIVIYVVAKGREKYKASGGISGYYENWQNDRAYSAETKNLGKKYRMALSDPKIKAELLSQLQANDKTGV